MDADGLDRFATMLPAFRADDRAAAEEIVTGLVDSGCVEFCTVGPLAEQLHDAIDAILEDAGAVHVVTTWHEDEDDACEYLLHAAAARPRFLLATVLDHPQLASRLLHAASAA